jgi:transposase
MRIDLENLPSDPMLLQRLVRDMAAAVETRETEIGRLQEIIRKLQRLQFGRRSERMTGGLDADQLNLALEDLDGDLAALREAGPAVVARSPERAPHRKALPDHVPREEVVLAPDSATCPCCGDALQPAGESVSEMLDWVPARVRVIRTRRPKLACRRCGTLHQHPAPERVIAGGLATPALLAQVLTAKYCDHTPLYRQSRIFARHGIDLARSTRAGWVGGACWWLEALHDRLRRDVLASNHLFADDTPVPVLDPGNGRTKTGRLWVYARDQRGWAGDAPPAAVYIFAPDRRAERPAAHLGAYRGVLHVDGYAGFERLTRGGTVTLAAWLGRTRGASSTTCSSRPARRLPRRRWSGSATSIWSRPRSAGSRRPSAWRHDDSTQGRWSTISASGSTGSCRSSRAAVASPRRSVTPLPDGRG